MREPCFETGFALQDLFLSNPISTAIGLLLVGATLTLLCTRLKTWRKLFGVLGIAALGWSVFAEPVRFSMLRSSALETSSHPEKWQANRSFLLRNAAQKIEAFRVELGSKCNRGFLVRSDESFHTETWGFVGTVPNSPAQYRREGIKRLIFDPHKACINRAEVMWGKNWRKDHPNVCSEPMSKLLFFDSSKNDPNGFGMKWCTRLNDNFAYCEADAADVAISTGTRF